LESSLSDLFRPKILSISAIVYLTADERRWTQIRKPAKFFCL
jgi:hypothetical protein